MDRIWAATMLRTLAKGLQDGDTEDRALAGILDDVRTAILAERTIDLAAHVQVWAAQVAEQLERETAE
jgi:hypothetical protein